MRSSFCGSGNCIEVGIQLDGVWIRDSKNPGQEPLWFSLAEWADFTAGVRNGEFDLPGGA